VAQVGRRWLLIGFRDVPPTDLAPLAAQLRSIADRLSKQSNGAACRNEVQAPED
jgi:hypothetical protein